MNVSTAPEKTDEIREYCLSEAVEPQSPKKPKERKRIRVRYGTDIVIKNNNLVSAVRQHNTEMGATEYKILMAVVAHVPRDIDLNSLTAQNKYVSLDIPREDIATACGYDAHHMYGKGLEKVLETIKKESVRILYPDGKIRLTGWVSVIEYYPGAGNIHVQIDPKMVQFLVADTRGFTRIGMPEISAMRSLRSILFYENIVRNEYIGKWEPTIQELRELLEAPEKSYPTTGALYKYIIKHAMNEINNTLGTRLIIKNAEYIKQVRKVVAIRFDIAVRGAGNQPVKIPSSLLECISPRLRKDHKFMSTITYDIAFNDRPPEQLRRIVLYAIENGGDKNDMAGWLRYCLEESLESDNDFCFPLPGTSSTGYNGPINDIKVTWTNIPDKQNREMWTGADGSLDIGNGVIMPPEKVREFLAQDQLVRLYC